jgi:hypothetical protein
MILGSVNASREARQAIVTGGLSQPVIESRIGERY